MGRSTRREGAGLGLINGIAFRRGDRGLRRVLLRRRPARAVIGIAMVGNLVVAAVVGVTVPMGLERRARTPPVASGVFVTTITDVVGFFAFLGLAAVMLT